MKKYCNCLFLTIFFVSLFRLIVESDDSDSSTERKKSRKKKKKKNKGRER